MIPLQYIFAGFQSLLHQGISLLRRRSSNAVFTWAGFQSLLHQGISLLSMLWLCPKAKSIRAFQSLLHQGISLLAGPLRPLSIRLDAVSIPSSSGHQFTGRRYGNAGERPDTVSIPSSSGHQFTAWNYPNCNAAATPVSIPSSSGHQFTEPSMSMSPSACSAMFQSLLHQGIS